MACGIPSTRRLGMMLVNFFKPGVGLDLNHADVNSVKDLAGKTFTEADIKEFEELDLQWKKAQNEPRRQGDRE